MTNYLSHFGLNESPFARNQHPKWIYLSPQNKEDLLKIRWTLGEYGGLALLRAGVGHGKSSLIEYMMSGWTKYLGWKCAKLQNTGSIGTPRALLAEIMAAFGLPTSSTSRKMVTDLETWLLEQSITNQPIVLFIDEAQSIGKPCLPILRDLLNLQTRERILLQIVLAGQLELDDKLKSFPALRSRIATSMTLEPLSLKEADAMLLHRFTVAGAQEPYRICSGSASRILFELSKGIPRDFITIADAAMKEAFLRGASQIVDAHVLACVRSLAGRHDFGDLSALETPKPRPASAADPRAFDAPFSAVAPARAA
ncbi:MAG TPA: AAA family ATPase [Chthonomonadaceae bacterium]|nr:AAA family ATPase [Chthonomonadaceae bacterium]